jgi:tetratricopeptide (TPR) repeat protein
MNTNTFLIPCRFKKNSVLLLFLCLLIPINSFALPSTLPADIHNSVTAIIDAIYKEDFKSSEELSKKLIRKYPDHPAGYFFMAASLDSWMSYYQSKKNEDEFYKYCDLTIDKCEKRMITTPSDDWASFFKGGADGYKGTYEARYERWITAFRYGWKGVSLLMKLEEKNSGIIDINYGIGVYEYWRSALMKLLWWMPGIQDKRQDGIKKLYMVYDQGSYTKLAASSTLIDILINEKKDEEALKIADKFLLQYPESSMFLWGKGNALFNLGKLDEANTVYSKLLVKYTSDVNNNHFNEVVCYFWLGKIAYQKGKTKEAEQYWIKMNEFTFDDDNKNRLSRYFNEVHSLLRNSNRNSPRKLSDNSSN